MLKSYKRKLSVLTLAGLLACGSQAQAETKNVFLMISDGASFGAWDMGDLYANGTTTSSSYFGAEYSKYLMTTFPLNTSTKPTGGHVATVSYDPAQAWDSDTNAGSSGGYANSFDAFEYLKQNYTDSAAAATAMSTGVKTYNNSINWDNDPATTGASLPTIAELAKDNGKAVGSISSVQWTHATPATFTDAQNISRNNYEAIANEILDGDVMDVVMGAGHPFFDDNNTAKATANYKYVGGSDTWTELVTDTHAGGWTLVESKADFEDLADGDGLYRGAALPDRVVGTALVGGTLQQSRSGYSASDAAFADPFNTGVPDLATMTNAAINLLDAKSNASGDNGFFLQIEGGAVDWAAHANQTSRIIEEQDDFNQAIDAVIAWIEANGGWGENLLVITTDHGNSMPLGADSKTNFMDRIELADITGTPSVQWFSSNHTNELVPVFVRGAGSEIFDTLVDGTDPYFSTYYPDWVRAGFDGRYIDNTDIFYGMKNGVAPVPEPATMLLFGTGLVGLSRVARRRK